MVEFKRGRLLFCGMEEVSERVGELDYSKA